MEKTRIEIETNNYVKGKGPSGGTTFHNGDAVATNLAGLSLEAVYSVASQALSTPVEDLQAKYRHLNPGQQRMNLGNRLRGLVQKVDKANASLKEGEEAGPSGAEMLAYIARPFLEAAAAEIKEAEAARQKAAEEKAAEKARKEAEKAEAKAAKEAAKEAAAAEATE